MTRVIVTAQVENSEAWERAFRTQTGLFRTYTSTAIHFTATSDNEVAILWEVTDLDQYLKQMASPETAEAMANDGVNQDSVKVYVLDKEIDL
jgi:hypothetical protein